MPEINKSDKPPSIGKPGGGGGIPAALVCPGLGGFLEYATKPMSIKLKHNINNLIVFLFILGLNVL